MNLDLFKEELKKLKIELNDIQLQQLHKYFELLVKYNKVMNLTGITEENEVYLKHFYDSVTLARVIDLNSVSSLCDIGTGAGFPGMVLKIIYPNLDVTLVDSLNKRIEFLKVVIKELGLTKIEAIHARAEEYAINNREKYDIVTARAVASLNVLLEYSIPLVKVNGYFIAMKGKMEEDASNALKSLSSKVELIDNFLLPIENSNRTLVKVKKEAKTASRFPRKFAEIKKKPL